jgi:hypothetical protein
MYNAGNPDKAVLSKLYLRYDCSDETLYALVLVNDWENNALKLKTDLAGEQWIKVYSTSSSGIIFDDKSGINFFRYISDPNDSTRIIGWEGSGHLISGHYTEDFEAHALMSNGDTSSTGKPNYISLKLNCNPIPEFPTIAVPVIMILGMMFIFQRRK